MTRRDFCWVTLAVLTLERGAEGAEPFAVQYARASPFDALKRFVEPGLDGFPGEKAAADLEARLRRIFLGAEPAPAKLAALVAQRGNIRWSRFQALPGNRVRYDIALREAAGLTHKTGVWSLP